MRNWKVFKEDSSGSGSTVSPESVVEISDVSITITVRSSQTGAKALGAVLKTLIGSLNYQIQASAVSRINREVLITENGKKTLTTLTEKYYIK